MNQHPFDEPAWTLANKDGGKLIGDVVPAWCRHDTTADAMLHGVTSCQYARFVQKFNIFCWRRPPAGRGGLAWETDSGFLQNGEASGMHIERKVCGSSRQGAGRGCVCERERVTKSQIIQGTDGCVRPSGDRQNKRVCPKKTRRFKKMQYERRTQKSIHTSLGNFTQTVPPASISFLFCGRTLTTTRTALLALSPPPPPPPPPPAPKPPAAAMPLPLGVLLSLSALDSDPAVEGAGERRPGVRALVGKGGVAMFSLEHELHRKATRFSS